MRQQLIAANWKMNTTLHEGVSLVKEMLPDLNRITNVEKLICPPYISIAAIKAAVLGSTVKIGAQNMYYQEKGAYTGEISPLMLSEMCEYVILGHSERRHIFYETNAAVNKKVIAAIKAGIIPILCVGEKLEERENGKTEELISSQLKQSLDGITIPGEMVVAYEPVWAIGTGKAATGPQANETIGFIRQKLIELFSRTIGANARILYGGSVTAENIGEFIQQPEIDGALVGGASLKPVQMVSMVEQAAKLKK